jgi:hypothetical protein
MDAAIEGLLHLGSMSVLVTAGYVGYDRIRRDSNDFYSQLSKLRKVVKDRFYELDVIKDGRLEVSNPIVDLFSARLLGHVAGIRTNESNRTCAWHWFKCTIWHAPGLILFRTRADRLIIMILCFLVLLAYLLLIWTTVYDVQIADNFQYQRFVFWFFTCTILGVFFALACSHWPAPGLVDTRLS